MYTLKKKKNYRFYLICMLPEIVDSVYKYRLMVSNKRESKQILQQKKISKKLF